jgi:proline iminopeptidase
MADGAFYPQIDPYDTGMLAVGGPHQIYWEQSGNPKGVPVVFLHGGPGAGASPAHRRFFDPAHYRIVIFDQRGAGRSKPLGEIQDNNTPQLVADIERLRQHLKIERWHVFGGSWGSTLAIAYAEHHPERVMTLCLRGIFLCRRSEIDWFLYGIRHFMPEAWREFAEHIPASERHDLLRAYYKRLTDPNPEIYMPAARRWSIYEARCCTLLPSPETVAASRAWKRTISRTTSSCRRISCSRISAASAISRRWWCRDATISSARPTPPTICGAPGPRWSSPWCPMPAIPRWSPVSAAAWSRRWIVSVASSRRSDIPAVSSERERRTWPRTMW